MSSLTPTYNDYIEIRGKRDAWFSVPYKVEEILIFTDHASTGTYLEVAEI